MGIQHKSTMGSLAQSSPPLVLNLRPRVACPSSKCEAELFELAVRSESQVVDAMLEDERTAIGRPSPVGCTSKTTCTRTSERYSKRAHV